MKKELVFRFDVSELNDRQIDALKAEVCAQAEESIDHYDVPVSFGIESTEVS